jgi:hypothetical protein
MKQEFSIELSIHPALRESPVIGRASTSSQSSEEQPVAAA